MFWNILLTIIALAAFAFFVQKGGSQQGNKVIFFFAFTFLLFISSLKYYASLPDLTNYFNDFHLLNQVGWENYREETRFNIGYSSLNYIVLLFTNNFQIFCLISSFIILYGYGKTISKYSPSIWLSLILFVIIDFVPSLYVLRQFIAISIFLLSFKYIINRQKYHFLALSLLAISFHSSAFIILPIYFLYGLSISKKTLTILVIGSGIAILIFNILLPRIATGFDDYSGYLIQHEHQATWERAIMKIYLLIIYCNVLRYNIFNTGINRVIFYCMILGIIICVGGIGVSGISRLREYFAVADFIGIPIILQYNKYNNTIKRKAIQIMILIYVIMLGIAFNRHISAEMHQNYKFYWESPY